MKKRQPSPQLLAVVSYNVRRLRLARGLTQRELARLCKTPLSYIGDVEQNTVNITLCSLELLAIGLECAVQDLVMAPPPTPLERGGGETDIPLLTSGN